MRIKMDEYEISKLKKEMTEEEVNKAEELLNEFLDVRCTGKWTGTCYTSSGDFAAVWVDGQPIYDKFYIVEGVAYEEYKGFVLICTPTDEAKKWCGDETFNLGRIDYLIPYRRAKDKMKKLIDSNKATIENVDKLLEVAKKFDGKVINKRFRDALKGTGFWGRFDGYNMEFTFGEADFDYRNLMNIWNYEEKGVIENKRLNYEKFAEQIEENRQRAQAMIDNWQYSIDHGAEAIEKWKEAARAYNKAAKELNDSIASEFLTIEDIDTNKAYMVR